MHPLLVRHGWDYVQAITWDKGIAHIAGNVNGKTIRRFPVVSEICVFYQRRFEVTGPDGPMPVQKWMRHEWQRAGLALNRANEACGVAQRGHPQVPHPGLALVLAAGRDDRAPGRLRQRARQAVRLALLLARRHGARSPPRNGTRSGTSGGTPTG